MQQPIIVRFACKVLCIDFWSKEDGLKKESKKDYVQGSQVHHK